MIFGLLRLADPRLTDARLQVPDEAPKQLLRDIRQLRIGRVVLGEIVENAGRFAAVGHDGVRRPLGVIQLAVRALLAYKVRSLLTMLGIIIGIGSVIVMISVGRGANASIQEQILSLGSNMLMVFSGSAKSGASASGPR